MFLRTFTFLRNSSFIKDFSVLFSGALLVQIISFAISPIISRLYTPGDFGIFTIYTQALGPLLILGGSSIFLMLPLLDSRKEEKLVLHLVAGLSSIVILVLFLVNKLNLINYDHINELFIYFLLGILITNLRNFSHYKLLSLKEYANNSKAKITEGTFGSISNLSFGYLGFNQIGLIWGNLISQLGFILVSLFNKTFEFNYLFKLESIGHYFRFVEIHKKKIISQSTSHMLEYVLILLFSLIITQSGSIKELGYYSFCQKILFMPLFIISEYFSQFVITRLSNPDVDRSLILKKVLLLIITPSIIGGILFSFWGSNIFSFVFGGEWLRSGEFAEVLCIAIFSTFIIRCLQYVPNILNKQEVYTFFSLLTYGAPVLILYIGLELKLDLIETFKYISITIFFLMLVYICILMKLFINKD